MTISLAVYTHGYNSGMNFMGLIGTFWLELISASQDKAHIWFH